MTDSKTAKILETLRARISTPLPEGEVHMRPHGLVVRRGKPAGPSLAQGRVHEILPDRPGHGAALGFAARCMAGAQAADPRPVLWATSWRERLEDGRLYAPGLEQAGMDVRRLLCVTVRRDKDMLWVLEEALGSGALAGVAGTVRALTLTASRRLGLAADRTGTALFLMRPAGASGATTAETRWQVTPLPSIPDPFDLQAPGRAAWRLDLLRHRSGPPATWDVECLGDEDDTQDALDLAAPARDRALAAPPAGAGLRTG